MAKVIKEFSRKYASGNRQYPWEEWTDGRIWRVEQGVDFASTPTSFRGNLSNRASHHGMRVRTRIEGNAVEFQFIPSEDA